MGWNFFFVRCSAPSVGRQLQITTAVLVATVRCASYPTKRLAQQKLFWSAWVRDVFVLLDISCCVTAVSGCRPERWGAEVGFQKRGEKCFLFFVGLHAFRASRDYVAVVFESNGGRAEKHHVFLLARVRVRREGATWCVLKSVGLGLTGKSAAAWVRLQAAANLSTPMYSVL